MVSIKSILYLGIYNSPQAVISTFGASKNRNNDNNLPSLQVGTKIVLIIAVAVWEWKMTCVKIALDLDLEVTRARGQ